MKLAIKRMHRRKGRHQRQAAPLTREVLDQLLAVCGNDVMGQRDRVMLLLGYETMRRRSELCAFRFEDLEILPHGRHAIRLRFSKTDQVGLGKLIPITNKLHNELMAWGELTRHQGRILRGLRRNHTLRAAMSPAAINRRLKALAQIADAFTTGLSGHSFRVGAAADLLAAGATLEKIMVRGGWTSESSALRYLGAWQGLD